MFAFSVRISALSFDARFRCSAYVACKRDNPLAFVAALLATGALLKV
jgi:hypothetical protein